MPRLAHCLSARLALAISLSTAVFPAAVRIAATSPNSNPAAGRPSCPTASTLLPAFDARLFATRKGMPDPLAPVSLPTVTQELPLTPTSGMVIYVNADGFWPTETEAVTGTCALTIRSVSDLEADLSVAVALTAVAQPEAPVPMPVSLFRGNAAAWQDISAVVALKPGVVDITETSHPDWHCRIAVLSEARP